ncbi:hypothetical protein FV226_11275 [Methylobacterium sp. WL12]|uniref:hypothetical protein n=1 Tax=Methylobacterium sp. WL12 TaxID=2603890 RepID=UPI0011C8AB6D|nr:hypothetical protein [Methylobacterium sp. WL12]TXM72755.1 hypothetical protein FV226_11275 [Methylobacterium sp. WL12]
MTQAVSDLANALARGIVTDEGAARDFAAVADTFRDDGHQASVDAMLRLSRHHRIRALEGRGNLAALRCVEEASDKDRS